jgi:copper chaperone
METLKFKTNIKCGGCIANVTPVLNHITEIKTWKVDTQDPNKILEIEGDKLNASDIVTSLKKAGYTAEAI